MSVNKIIVICFVIIVVLGIGAFIWFMPNTPKIGVTDESSSTTSGATSLQTVTQNFDENSPAYSVEVQYPKIQGMADMGIENTVNNAIQSAVYAEIAQFHSSVGGGSGGTSGAAGAASSTLPAGGVQSTFNASYTVSLLTPSFFSATMSYSEYTSGSVNASDYVGTLDYNLQTGDAVTLENVLQGLNPSSGYFSRLGKAAQANLTQQFGNSGVEQQLIQTGGAATDQNYANFTLDYQNLNIIFDPCQVTDCASGSAQAQVPYGTLMSQVIEPAGYASGSSSTATGASVIASSTLWWLQ